MNPILNELMVDISSAEEDTRRRAIVRKKLNKRLQVSSSSQTKSSESKHQTQDTHKPSQSAITPPKPLTEYADTRSITTTEPIPRVCSMSEFALTYPHTQLDDQAKPKCLLGIDKYTSTKKRNVLASIGITQQESNAIHQSPGDIGEDVLGSEPNLSIISGGGPYSTQLNNVITTTSSSSSDHNKQVATKAWFTEALKKKIEQLTVPRFYQDDVVGGGGSSSDALSDALRRGQVHIPVMPSQLESELLCEAGRWEHSRNCTYDFPACARGDKCVCTTEYQAMGAPKPFVCTAMMYPREWKDFLESFTPPQVIRPCIMCLRFTLADYITFLRQQRMYTDTPDTTQGSSLDCNPVYQESARYRAPSVFQLYYNLVDCPGGYHKEYILKPQAGENIIQPIVRPCVSFCPVSVLQNGRLYIDQSAIACSMEGWKPSDRTPNIGENLRHF